MKKLFTILTIALSINILFSQECDNYKLSDNLVKTRDNDSTFKKDVELRIEYFVVLNKEILPKYTNLKTKILNEIEYSDLNDILELKTKYNHSRLYYLNEFKAAQANTHKNVNAYSKINIIILLETLDVFPDSYAMIFNPSLMNNRTKNRDIYLQNKFYKKYEEKLSELKDCYQQMKTEMKKHKDKLGIIDVFQNTGNKTLEEQKKSDLIDMLIWSLK